jgi:hypothetical protein
VSFQGKSAFNCRIFLRRRLAADAFCAIMPAFIVATPLVPLLHQVDPAKPRSDVSH